MHRTFARVLPILVIALTFSGLLVIVPLRLRLGGRKDTPLSSVDPALIRRAATETGRRRSGIGWRVRASILGIEHAQWVAFLEVAGPNGWRPVGHTLAGLDLGSADLHDLILWETKLIRVNLSDSDLRRANLYRSVFQQVKMRRADLRQANLCDADLQGCDLGGADLTGAWYSERTRWPAGFDH